MWREQGGSIQIRAPAQYSHNTDLLQLSSSSSIAYPSRSRPHYSINMVAMSLAQATAALLLFMMSVPRSSAAQQVSFSSYNLKQL
jgi:hypothetical protein